MTSEAQSKLLVVEDEEVNLQILRNILSSQNYQVLVAEDGKKALQLLEQEKVDMILLDIELPVLDGLDVLKKVRENPEYEKVPIIMLTGKDTSEDIVKALDMGANDYITKPIDIAVLLARIQAQFAIHRDQKS